MVRVLPDDQYDEIQRLIREHKPTEAPAHHHG